MREPRVAETFPLVGGLPGFVRNPARYCLNASRAYPGELLRLRLGPSSVLLASAPEHVEHIYLRNPDNYWKGTLFNALRPVFGRGLLLAEGAEWRHQRQQVQPAFHARCFRDLLPSLEAIVEDTTSAWCDGEVLDLERHTRRLTMRVILRMMLSSSVSARAIGAIEGAFERLLRRAPLVFATAFIPGASRAVLRSATAVLDREVALVVAERRAADEQPTDLLTRLLSARSPEGDPLDDRLVRDQLVTTIFGGYEATATALYWMWLLLDRHPDVRARVQAEVDAATSYEQLVYGRQVIDETLRLMPPFWESFRTAYADDECAGYRVRARESVLVSIFSVHRDARYWPDPDRFDPDRFAPGRPPRHRAAFVPFQIGTRACIGKHIAMGEMLLALWVIARRWHLEIADPAWRLDIHSGGSLRPRGAPRMICRRRQ
jgi:enediyne biosynthesis protein E7